MVSDPRSPHGSSPALSGAVGGLHPGARRSSGREENGASSFRATLRGGVMSASTIASGRSISPPLSVPSSLKPQNQHAEGPQDLMACKSLCRSGLCSLPALAELFAQKTSARAPEHLPADYASKSVTSLARPRHAPHASPMLSLRPASIRDAPRPRPPPP
jgi:hypothetical protein